MKPHNRRIADWALPPICEKICGWPMIVAQWDSTVTRPNTVLTVHIDIYTAYAWMPLPFRLVFSVFATIGQILYAPHRVHRTPDPIKSRVEIANTRKSGEQQKKYICSWTNILSYEECANTFYRLFMGRHSDTHLTVPHCYCIASNVIQQSQQSKSNKTFQLECSRRRRHRRHCARFHLSLLRQHTNIRNLYILLNGLNRSTIRAPFHVNRVGIFIDLEKTFHVLSVRLYTK